jgi:hypothetical protein
MKMTTIHSGQKMLLCGAKMKIKISVVPTVLSYLLYVHYEGSYCIVAPVST